VTEDGPTPPETTGRLEDPPSPGDSRPCVLDVSGEAQTPAGVPFIMPETLARTDPMKAFTEMVLASGPYRSCPVEFVSGKPVPRLFKFDGYVPRKRAPGLGDGPAQDRTLSHFRGWNGISFPESGHGFGAFGKAREADWGWNGR